MLTKRMVIFVKKICKTCYYFRQHYVRLYHGRYNAAGCGHCKHLRLKPRRPDTAACQYYEEYGSKEN